MSSGPWLAIDTATDMAGIAVCHAERVVSERTWSSRRHHTRQLAPAVADALVEAGLGVADLEGIAVAIGPGSYTGLRIGLSLAKGLSLGAAHARPGGRPVAVIGIPTLDIVAAPLSPPDGARTAPLWAVLEAGRSRVIAARYGDGAATGGSGWPDARTLAVWTIDDLVHRVAPGDWVAGELTAEARAALEGTGARVLPAAAGLRRPGWLAHLGRQQLHLGPPPDVATLSPIYSGGEPAPPPLPSAAVVVRLMTPDDVAAVTELHDRAFLRVLDAQHFSRELANPIATTVVAVLGDGPIVGFAGLWRQVDEGHVMTIGVEPRLQSRGIGGRLLARLVEIAAADGLAALTLEVRDGNAAAQALYRRFGFEVVGRRTRYYSDTGEDALIMTRGVSP
ncbi:MAG: tRNA (adenosine(37)-N6)-threonylcarbamoyltransferase complex dimerization subunit type 1 TsaB [Ardenticatenales bacterium]|nr:tRNA (adenosine(37)-N6)-threonylcarbamoyltransferase complex dimerization subunit type 1 TsaB [Ardenticatenales bacterium]